MQRYMQNQDAETDAMFDLIDRMLCYEPDQRIKLSEALDHKFFDTLPDSQRLDHARRPGKLQSQNSSSGSETKESKSRED